MPLIYKITNQVNGKIYVGQTTLRLEQRWRKHLLDARNGRSCALHNAVRKYGDQNFDIETLEECSSEELDKLEIAWIKQLCSAEKEYGYNLTLGGKNGEMTEEVKKKLSAMRMGAGNPQFGKTHTAEARERISKAHKGRTAPNKGKPHSEEHIAKISAAQKATWVNPTDTRLKSILRGSAANGAKLTESDIPVIRELLELGWSQAKIAKKYNVKGMTIGNIFRRKTWNHVP